MAKASKPGTLLDETREELPELDDVLRGAVVKAAKTPEVSPVAPKSDAPKSPSPKPEENAPSPVHSIAGHWAGVEFCYDVAAESAEDAISIIVAHFRKRCRAVVQKR